MSYFLNSSVFRVRRLAESFLAGRLELRGLVSSEAFPVGTDEEVVRLDSRRLDFEREKEGVFRE